jgi:hypothetical protein
MGAEQADGTIEVGISDHAQLCSGTGVCRGARGRRTLKQGEAVRSSVGRRFGCVRAGCGHGGGRESALAEAPELVNQDLMVAAGSCASTIAALAARTC